jgi:hypothetical protein
MVLRAVPSLAVGVILTVVLSGCSGGGSAGAGPGPGASAGAPRPKTLVAVTTQGAVEVLDARRGTVLRTLAVGAVGDEVSVSSTQQVFFEKGTGCEHQIDAVALAGGPTTVVGNGSVPMVSPDGTELAYMRQPVLSSPDCRDADLAPSAFALVVRRLATGAETTFLLAPQVAADGLPYAVDHLSWSWNSQELAVSVAAPEDNEGWRLVVVHPGRDHYYFSGTGVPVAGGDPTASYYREGVFLPDGDLFVDRVCCAGIPVDVTSDALLEIAPATGSVTRHLATDADAQDHASLAADPSGRWLLYLSGGDLVVSDDGAAPTVLGSGFVAADWS